jgi:hypothetical protein
MPMFQGAELYMGIGIVVRSDGCKLSFQIPWLRSTLHTKIPYLDWQMTGLVVKAEVGQTAVHDIRLFPKK